MGFIPIASGGCGRLAKRGVIGAEQREHDERELRVADIGPERSEQVEAAFPRHELIREHDVEGLPRLEPRERLIHAADGHRLEAEELELGLRLARQTSRSSTTSTRRPAPKGLGSCSARAAGAGRVTQKRDPCPGSLVTPT